MACLRSLGGIRSIATEPANARIYTQSVETQRDDPGQCVSNCVPQNNPVGCFRGGERKDLWPNIFGKRCLHL